MGNGSRNVPGQAMTSSAHLIPGLLPSSPQKSPTLVNCGTVSAFVQQRRLAISSFPPADAPIFQFPSRIADLESMYYKEETHSECGSPCGSIGTAGSSPEMIRRSSSNPHPMPGRHQQPGINNQSQQYHRKVARSQSEPKSPNMLLTEFGSPQNNGPLTAGHHQASNRFKTELCNSFRESGSCRYGDKCQFAHGEQELRSVARHAKYKTERCTNFHANGFCAYGKRCHFIHDEAENPRRASVSNSAAERSLGGSNGSPVRDRAVSVSTFPPPVHMSSMIPIAPKMHQFADGSSLNLGSCGNSRSNSYSSTPPLSISPGIPLWQEQQLVDAFGSNCEVFLRTPSTTSSSSEEEDELPGPWVRSGWILDD